MVQPHESASTSVPCKLAHPRLSSSGPVCRICHEGAKFGCYPLFPHTEHVLCGLFWNSPSLEVFPCSIHMELLNTVHPLCMNRFQNKWGYAFMNTTGVPEC